MTPQEAREDVLACCPEEGGPPGSDALVTPNMPTVIRFRWPTGLWFVFLARDYATNQGGAPRAGQDWEPLIDGLPWPKHQVDSQIDSGFRITDPQVMAKLRARTCMLHEQPFAACGCPTMYEVLELEAQRRAKAVKAKVSEVAEKRTPGPPPAVAAPSATAQAPSTPGGSGPATVDQAGRRADRIAELEAESLRLRGVEAQPEPPQVEAHAPPTWHFECLDCRRSMGHPPMPASGVSCPECEHKGVFVWRDAQPKPGTSPRWWADMIASDGVVCDPNAGACYVCGGPMVAPGGACLRLRNGHARAHLACVQTQRDPNREVPAASTFVRVGDPAGYCLACKRPFAAGDKVLFQSRAHADVRLCQAGPEPVEQLPPAWVVGRALKKPCVLCGKPIVKDHKACNHLDGVAHLVCVSIPKRLDQEAIP